MALTAAAVPSEDPSSTTMISCVENKRSPTFDAASTASVTFASSSCAGSTIEHPGRPDTSNDASGSKSGPSTHVEDRQQWRRPDSNRRPPACKAGALPTELRPRAVGLYGANQFSEFAASPSPTT